MDVGWFDDSKGKLVFLELKGEELWDKFDKSKDEAHTHLVKNLREKATDVLLMLAAVWSKTKIGKGIKEILPVKAHRYSDGILKFIFLLDTPDSRKPLLIHIQDAVNKELAGRVRLFGMERLTVIDFDKAKELGLPVTREA